MTDTNTKLRFLTQMLANVEQLVQSSNEMGLHTETIEQYRTYVLQEIQSCYAENDEVSDDKA